MACIVRDILYHKSLPTGAYSSSTCADEAAAREADKVALKCSEKDVLPHLNFPLSEYGASKDKSMARIVRDVVDHFQPLHKALPQSVLKQLAEAEAALAANASCRKPAKRRRKAEEQQPSEAWQEGELEKIPFCSILPVPACSPFFVQPVHPPWLYGVPVKGFNNREGFLWLDI